jgi:multidrug resistance efflux pump
MYAKLRLLVVLVAMAACVAVGVFAGPALKQAVDPPTPPVAKTLTGASFGRVDLEQGCSLLSPLQPGVVVEVKARENASVKAGDTLVRLEDKTAKARVDAAMAAVEAAKTRVTLARQAPERHRLRLETQKAAVQAAESRLSAAKQVRDVKREQLKSSLINQSEVAVAEDQVKELIALKTVEANRLTELETTSPDQEVRAAEADLSSAEAQLRVAEEALEHCTMKAPRDGTVVRVQATPGEVIGGMPRQQVVVFAAAAEPWVIRAEVEQEFAPEIKVGQPAEVQDEVNPEIRFFGKVKRLSPWYLQRRESLRDPTRYSDATTVECIIAPDDKDLSKRMRLGQRVRVLFREAPKTEGQSNNDKHTSVGTTPTGK